MHRRGKLERLFDVVDIERMDISPASLLPLSRRRPHEAAVAVDRDHTDVTLRWAEPDLGVKGSPVQIQPD